MASVVDLSAPQPLDVQVWDTHDSMWHLPSSLRPFLSHNSDWQHQLLVAMRLESTCISGPNSASAGLECRPRENGQGLTCGHEAVCGQKKLGRDLHPDL